jgi:hypothetical protein
MGHGTPTFTKNPRTGIKFMEGRQMKTSKTNLLALQKASSKISKQPKIHQMATRSKNSETMAGSNAKLLVGYSRAIVRISH